MAKNWQNHVGLNVRLSVRPSGVCVQDCDVIYGPVFTKFGT